MIVLNCQYQTGAAGAKSQNSNHSDCNAVQMFERMPDIVSNASSAFIALACYERESRAAAPSGHYSTVTDTHRFTSYFLSKKFASSHCGNKGTVTVLLYQSISYKHLNLQVHATAVACAACHYKKPSSAVRPYQIAQVFCIDRYNSSYFSQQLQ